METSKQRIERILDYKSINPKQLSEILGLNRPQKIYDVLKEKTKNISPNLSIQIISAFPEISRTWLLTGDGDMFAEQNEQKKTRSVGNQSGELVEALRNHISDLQAERDRLLDEIEELKAEIDSLRQSLGMTSLKKETA